MTGRKRAVLNRRWVDDERHEWPDGTGLPDRARLHGRGAGARRTPSGGPRPSGRWRTSRSPGSAWSGRTSRRWPGSRRPPPQVNARARRARQGHRGGDRRRRPPRSPTGRWDEHFPVDVFQTGSGTSSNMNTNEVIATLATERLGPRRCTPTTTSTPRQSSNDVFPSSIHIAATAAVTGDLIPALEPPRGGAGAQGGGVRRGREVGPHAPDGRHAGDAGPGVRRLRGAGAVRRRAAARPRCPGSPSCRSAAPRSAPASTPRPASPPRSSPRWPAPPGCR